MEHAVKHLIAKFATLVSLAMACSMPLGAAAASLTAADEEQIRQVIEQQFEAFAQDDADRAFELATPSVRESIGTAGMLLAMVRGSYPMVYRPTTFVFLKVPVTNGPVLQMVQLTDSDEKTWLAIFTVEQQSDSTWRISGCMVGENTWRAT
jgi:Domain of unknown function (DUF4864)